MKIYDISQELFGCVVFPGDPAPERRILLEVAKGDVCNLTAFSMCAHNGTHVDAPYHFLQDGKRVDQLALSTLIGYAYVAEVQGDVTARRAEEILREARARNAEAADRILIKGDAVVTIEAARVFASAGVKLVGNESQTVGPENAPMAVHLLLLGGEVVLLEGVRLASVPEGRYLLHAAPLCLGGAEGAPCRATLLDPDEIN